MFFSAFLTEFARISRVASGVAGGPDPFPASYAPGAMNHCISYFSFYRATLMHNADYPVARVCLPVCLSVRLSHAGIESKRLCISSMFFHHRVAPPFQFSRTKRDVNIPTGTLLTGASNARGYEKITIFDQYLALSRN